MRSPTEPLEPRLHLAAAGTAAIEGGVLYIQGTKNADYIDIRRDPNTNKRVLITINGRAFRFQIADYSAVSLDTNKGNDRVVDNGGWKSTNNITLNGGAGDDWIESASYSNRGVVIEGGSGNDKITGYGNSAFILFGRGGNDTLTGGDGDDSLYGEEGDDQLFTGRGNNFANGGEGNDSIVGGIGDDSLDGSNGNDTLRSGGGNDTLIGYAGNDLLIVSPGLSRPRGENIRGGSGKDILDLEGNAQLDGNASGIEVFR